MEIMAFFATVFFPLKFAKIWTFYGYHETPVKNVYHWHNIAREESIT